MRQFVTCIEHLTIAPKCAVNPQNSWSYLSIEKQPVLSGIPPPNWTSRQLYWWPTHSS